MVHVLFLKVDVVSELLQHGVALLSCQNNVVLVPNAIPDSCFALVLV